MDSVKIEKVMEILHRHNVHISLDQARLILDFMIKFAKLSLSQNERT